MLTAFCSKKKMRLSEKFKSVFSALESFASGFTLVEMLVVAAITVFLSSYVILYTNIGRKQTALYIKEATIGQYILRAKSFAVTTKRLDLNVPCGYGVRIDYNTATYYLFSYSYRCSDITKNYTIGTGDTYSYTDQNGNIITVNRYSDISSSTLNTAEGVKFSSGPLRLDMVFFLAPTPTAFISAGDGKLDGTSGNIYLVTSDGTAAKTINVTAPLGQVNF
jgi:prepilin-type N-terminal cleavage/methylation domain-containing protein